MEVSITTMSSNGQVVIPSEIRKEAGLKPLTKFIIFNQKGDIMLKKINKEALAEEIELMRKVARAEDDIKNGRYLAIDKKMKPKEMDKLLREGYP